MDQFLLFGDSITQQAFSPHSSFSFGSALSNAYIRRLDIINRGLSGYNTSQALLVLPLILSPRSQTHVRILTIFFGANDARLPNTPGGPQQHVSLDEYARNLRAIVRHEKVKEHEGCHVVLITPPPVDERQALRCDREKDPGCGDVNRRTARVTARYAQAVREVGAGEGVPVLDVWRVMIERAGGGDGDADSANAGAGSGAATAAAPAGDGHIGDSKNPATATTAQEDETDYIGSSQLPENQILQSFLSDGLHLSEKGYALLYEELMKLIIKTWPEDDPEKMDFVLPYWADGEAFAKLEKEAKAMERG